jgi:uncharacterized protein YecT (DUF1311 family)
MPRDPVSEIVLIKERAGKYRRVPSYYDIDRLRSSWETKLKGIEPSDDLIPIRIVTLVEVFLKHWIETFIDFGAPYVERAAKLGTNIKYDFAIARSLQGGAVSLGQLIAHSVPLSRLDSVCAVFNSLLGRDLFDTIEKTRDRWRERHEPGIDPIIPDVAHVRRTLGRLFEVRNIIVHEIPEAKVHEATDVAEFLDASSKFMQAAEEEFVFILYNKVPMSQSEINQDSANRHQQAVEELESLCAKIEAETGSKEIHDVQRTWSAFKKAEADRITQWHLRGSIRPMIWSMTAARITRDRIREIQELEANRID